MYIIIVGRRNWETRQDRGKNAAMYRDQLDEKLLQNALDLCGNGSSFSRTTNPKLKAKISERLQNNSVDVLQS